MLLPSMMKSFSLSCGRMGGGVGGRWGRKGLLGVVSSHILAKMDRLPPSCWGRDQPGERLQETQKNLTISGGFTLESRYPGGAALLQGRVLGFL